MKITQKSFSHLFTRLHSQQKALIILAFLLIVSAFLRLYRIDQLPSELHRDETAIGYNAYSLLTTGKDEHGTPFPVTFTSYGDYKLPVLIYSTVVSIKVFGVSPFAVRLPTIIFSLLFIPISYAFGYELFKSRRRALITAAVVTFSVWHTFLSRTAYEPIVGLTLSTLGLLFFLKARTHSFFLPLSAMSFFVACMAYNIPMLLGPVLLVSISLIYKNEYFQGTKKVKSLIGLSMIIFTFLLAFILTFSATKGKTGTTIFSDTHLSELNQNEFASFIAQGIPYKISILLSNKIIFTLRYFVSGYAAVWNPAYLFIRGGESPWHSLHAVLVGDFHWGVIPFLLLGFWEILSFFQTKKTVPKEYYFILFYLFCAPLVNSVTLDSPNTNRLLDFHFAISLIIVVGIFTFYEKYVQKKPSVYKNIASIFLCIVFFGTWFDSLLRYDLLHRYTLDLKWNEGISETVKSAKLMDEGVQRIYLDTDAIPDSHLLYSYFALYGQIDPEIFHNKSQWSRQLSFLTPTTFGKYQFILPVDIQNGTQRSLGKYFPDQIDTVLFVKRLKGNEAPSKYNHTVVNDAFGKPIWEVARISKQDLIEDK